MRVLPTAVLLLTALGFVGFGTAYLLRPDGMARATELVLPTETARIDFTATYGGFQIGFGAFLLACVAEQSWLVPGLWASTLALVGFGVVRALGMARARAPLKGTLTFAMALEIAGVLLNGLGLAIASGALR